MLNIDPRRGLASTRRKRREKDRLRRVARKYFTMAIKTRLHEERINSYLSSPIHEALLSPPFVFFVSYWRANKSFTTNLPLSQVSYRSGATLLCIVWTKLLKIDATRDKLSRLWSVWTGDGIKLSVDSEPQHVRQTFFFSSVELRKMI